MHITCVICSDLLNQAENIYVTKCGHLFHYACLSQWIARSKSCPQCRHKVTDKCMFRLFPTISNETPGEDVTIIQSRLDDVQLQLRQQKAAAKEQSDKLVAITANWERNQEMLKAYESKLISRESAVTALKEQVHYLMVQNKETQKLKEENDALKKNLQTLNGLQTVLNATSEEVEDMLKSYSDVKTVATFATALKRALCESETKKNECRDHMQTLKQQVISDKMALSELQTKLMKAERKLSFVLRKYERLRGRRQLHEALKNSMQIEDSSSTPLTKMKRSAVDDNTFTAHIIEHDYSCDKLVNCIELADSPYLNLRQSSLVLTALQRHPSHPLPDGNLKPSELAMLNLANNETKRSSENQTSVGQTSANQTSAGQVSANQSSSNQTSASQTSANQTSANQTSAHKTSVNQTSIFHKKQPTIINLDTENDVNLSQLNVSYDGLGGHSKLETFPKPCTRPPIKSCVPKLTAKHRLKRPAAPAGSQHIGKMLEKMQKQCPSNN